MEGNGHIALGEEPERDKGTIDVEELLDRVKQVDDEAAEVDSEGGEQPPPDVVPVPPASAAIVLATDLDEVREDPFSKDLSKVFAIPRDLTFVACFLVAAPIV